MSYFTDKVQQIRFRLALRSRPGWGSLQAPSLCYRGDYL